MEITRTEMKNILSGVNHPDMISYTSSTPVDMNKYLDYWLVDEKGKRRKNPNPTPNPYLEDGILKHSKMYKVITGFDYVNSVNTRRGKEGKEKDFVGGFSEENKMCKDWYTYIGEDGKEHRTFRKDDKGNPILKEREVWFDVISKGLVTDKKTRSKFYLRYQIQPDSEIGEPKYTFNGTPIMREFFENFIKESDNHYDNQELDNPLNFLVCDLNNVNTISMGGVVYELTGMI